MNKFYNPYNFIPVTGKVNGHFDGKSYKALETGGDESCVRHDLWHKNGLSGYFTCRITLETPTFVGGQRKKQSAQDRPAEVEHYLRDDTPAIPGNSIRGMIANIAESLSQSALRVLDGRNYSVREVASAARNKKVGRIERMEDGTLGVREMGYFKVRSDRANQVYLEAGGRFCYGNTKNRAISSTHQDDLIKGELRILDAPSDTVPRNRSNELFVYESSRKIYPLDDKVISAFHDACRERWESTATDSEQQPYLYKGWESNKGKLAWQLQPNLLLYFRLVNGEVSELSTSLIWRTNIGKSAHDFFSEIHPELLPWGESGRDQLTIAERLFGFAEDLSSLSEQEKHSARNLASRVRFSDGLPEEGQDFTRWRQALPVTLRILSSPKPPSPAMYFKDRSNTDGYLTKDNLRFKGVPNGRKVYIHHPENQISDTSWVTKDNDINPRQKVQVKPLPRNMEFVFNVRFDNLTNAELTLLKTSLRPADEYRHRLGMGKSLGLGSIRLDVESLHLADRKNAYGKNGLQQPLFVKVWTPDGTALPIFGETKYIDDRTLGIIRAVGDPKNLEAGVPVKPALTQDQVDEGDDWESNGFLWFVENDRVGNNREGQVLTTIEPGKTLPTLRSGFGHEEARLFAPAPKNAIQSGKSEWLRQTLQKIRQESPNLQNKTDAKLLKSLPLAEHWANIKDESQRKAELEALTQLWTQNNSGPSDNAKRLYEKQ